MQPMLKRAGGAFKITRAMVDAICGYKCSGASRVCWPVTMLCKGLLNCFRACFLWHARFGNEVLSSIGEAPFVLAASGSGTMEHNIKDMGDGVSELSYSANIAGSYTLSVRCTSSNAVCIISCVSHTEALRMLAHLYCDHSAPPGNGNEYCMHQKSS